MTGLIPSTKPSDIDALLRSKMQGIEELIEAIANEEPYCDLKLAELLEDATERGRIAIVEKLREMLRARAEEKEKELDKYLEAQRREEITRQRNAFRQWLVWIMSEKTLRKIRDAFLAAPMLENLVRGIGHNLANSGVQNQMAPSQKQDLGALSANIAQAAKREREKKDKGRS
jgi:hypothetical protein